MKNGFALLALAFLAAGCRNERNISSGGSTSQETSGPATRSASPGELGFAVNVALSETARKALAQSNETIIVRAEISGPPKKGVKPKYVTGRGDMELAAVESQMTGPGIARFSNIRLPENLVRQVEGGQNNYQVLINVFSGRKSSKDNLLDCSSYDADLKAIQDHHVDITCKLIGEVPN